MANPSDLQDPSARPVVSAPDLLALHAVRLKGLVGDGEAAARYGLDPEVVREALLDHEARGWVTRRAFAGTRGWTLTESGRAEGERRLAGELAETGLGPFVREQYEMFLAYNDRCLRACTDWQLRPDGPGRLTVNDHGDAEWDGRVLDELTELGRVLESLSVELGARIVRLGGYGARFTGALTRVRRGELSWVDRVKEDSCHTVWMELHEDLLATLGIARGEEPKPRAQDDFV
ncbi:transcriptional regulator [Streptomyces sp. NBC_00250]|uniref:transcriptional regulator n=1 Tax=Streptomyces sp. NBC_00250 TaxID=2903641 RepID=UPI002E2BF386|nr:transcriptional regulator [Streptomyces sp. NBC_00250]